MKLNKEVFRYHFARGTWISIAWNWLLINVGRAAEGYLTLSVLYQGASLLPGVHTPASVDNTVFIGQQLALDIGGISLAKQSQQTRQAGHKAQADLERRVGFLLISLMIANVILSQLRRFQIIPDPVVVVIEVLLLIFRSVMAVVYGYIVYSPTMSEDASVVRTSDIRERLDEYNEHLADVQRLLPSLVQTVVQSQSHLIISEIEQVVHSQLKVAVQSMISGLPELVSGQVQTLISEQVNGQAQMLLSELPLLVQSSVSEQVSMVVQAIENDNSAVALQQLSERLREVSTSMSEMRTTITEVRTVTQRKAVSEHGDGGAKRLSTPTISLVHSSPKVVESRQGSEQANGQVGERVKGYIVEQRELGSEPSLSEIMDRCECSKGSAIRYRRELDEPSTGEIEKIVVNE